MPFVLSRKKNDVQMGCKETDILSKSELPVRCSGIKGTDEWRMTLSLLYLD